MLKKEIQLLASVDKLAFSDGSSTFEFEPKLFLNQEGLITGVGLRPTDGGDYTELDLFANSTDRAFDYLVAAIQYGLLQFAGRLRVLPSHLQVRVSHDLASMLRGFEAQLFKQAGKEAGAINIDVRRFDG